MGTEIERRFRVNRNLLHPNGEDGKRFPQGRYYKQGYLSQTPSIRVRCIAWDDIPSKNYGQAMLTIKGPGTIKRPEFNIQLPVEHAVGLMELAMYGIIEKVRYTLPYANPNGKPWELDKFLGEHEGLWLAEIELNAVDQEFQRPPWLGEEVTEDKRFNNGYLAMNDRTFWARAA